MLVERRVPGELVDEFVLRAANALVPALTEPTRLWFDGDVRRARDLLILRALAEAVDELEGGGLRPWGESHEVIFAHPLGITEAARQRFNIGPFSRAGYAETVLSISGRRPETSTGPSFSAVFDAADWDRSIAQNPPGQSEARDSGHFADLARMWAAGESFRLAFSEAAITANAESTLTLTPRRNR
jgi:penicillin amidase